MSTLARNNLISTLTSLPDGEMVEVIAHALGSRLSELARPRGHVRPAISDDPARVRLRKTGEAGCCGLSFTSEAKSVICPLCGKRARAA